VRGSTAIRAGALAVVAAGVALPPLRGRLRLPNWAVLAPSTIAPAALCVLAPPSRRRDVGVSMLQMWAYIAAYEMPADEPDVQRRRVHVRYPVAIDKVIGFGKIPSVRLQRRFHEQGRLRALERVLVWSHWVWFMIPHATLITVLLRRRERFAASAARMYAVFDLGAIVYSALPTAPPWYAGELGLLDDGDTRHLRRLMLEYGEEFWRDGWGPIYSLLAGNQLAAMPSLHFATSVMGAHLLAEQGTVEGAIGWTYALTLGVALVYLGEHYVVDLLAGLALTESVRRAAPRLTPAAKSLAGGLDRLRLLAQG
jgi:membrane-associated phospholipid phosphatase